MKVNLVVVEGVHQGQVIPLKGERFEIGRGEGCQLRPKSQTVSIRQCAIVRRGRHVTVEDLGSTNGTLVNERCLRMGDEVRVSDGDRLQVGQLIFTVRIDADPVEGADRMEDWLKAGPITGPAADVDMNSHTLLMAAPVHVEPPPGVAAPPAGDRTVSPSPDAQAPRFAYRVFDAKHQAVILGLSQEQMEGDEGACALRKTLNGLIEKKKVRRMVLDLSAVDELSSLALATLLALARQCAHADGELRLCGVSPDVKRMTSALRLNHVMASYSDRDEAVADAWR